MLAAHVEGILDIDPIERKDKSRMMDAARSITAWRIKQLSKIQIFWRRAAEHSEICA